MELQGCTAYALENNITIKEAALNTSIATVDYDNAKSSRLMNLFVSALQNFSNGDAIFLIPVFMLWIKFTIRI